ncbi:hypothetical protein C922_05525 [Plasmodium inui San Antonio 1]|uniref:Uncharacterized protein n=1 Tax=Plasmodium inui San Antonio 1 TaxID=1237626 RepID=W6ZXS2_9APIC|nr:hypothetical protein C922_05525 [Plasmodium inui San Antonio 1]EUD64098.1 hypothetical protein C922_05525 [Plasmodium inui San Antonio 1]
MTNKRDNKTAGDLKITPAPQPKLGKGQKTKNSREPRNRKRQNNTTWTTNKKQKIRPNVQSIRKNTSNPTKSNEPYQQSVSRKKNNKKSPTASLTLDIMSLKNPVSPKRDIGAKN